MPQKIIFDVLHEYDTLETGIVVPATLKSGENFVDLKAKVDTGATFCVFERVHGLRLGLKIETGFPLRMTTATGAFDAFGHTINLSILGIETETTVLFRGGRKFLSEHLGQARFFRPRETRFN